MSFLTPYLHLRFAGATLAGILQTLLLNGPSTNSPKLTYDIPNGTWGWGLTVPQYYGLILAIVGFTAIPILWMKEPDPKLTPQLSTKAYFEELWATLKERSTLYLIIYAVGISALTNFFSLANYYMQYYVITLNNFQAGTDTIYICIYTHFAMPAQKLFYVINS